MFITVILTDIIMQHSMRDAEELQCVFIQRMLAFLLNPGFQCDRKNTQHSFKTFKATKS